MNVENTTGGSAGSSPAEMAPNTTGKPALTSLSMTDGILQRIAGTDKAEREDYRILS